MSHRRCIYLAMILSCLALSGCATTTSTPGETTADSLLQRDVQRFITAFERSHGSAGEVVDTKVVSIEGSVATEQWYVQRGDTVVIYTLKFTPSPLGGTDVQWTVPEQDQKKP